MLVTVMSLTSARPEGAGSACEQSPLCCPRGPVPLPQAWLSGSLLPALHTNLMDRMRCLAHWPARSLPAPEHVQSRILGDMRSRNWLGRRDLGPPLAFKISSSGTLSKIIWSSHCLQQSQAGAGGVLARLEGSPPTATGQGPWHQPIQESGPGEEAGQGRTCNNNCNGSSSLGSPFPLQSPQPPLVAQP